jgi:hypothetical protein
VKTHAADGKEAYIIDCKAGPFACARQAGDLCGSRGYHPLDAAGNVIPPQATVGNLRQMMITCGNAPQTIYSGESQPPAQSNGETASKLLNQPTDAPRPPPQSGGATAPQVQQVR